jgi:hypothetical protein
MHEGKPASVPEEEKGKDRMLDGLKEEPAERGFDPRPYMISLKGKSYLPIAPRIMLFREQCSVHDGWGIITEMLAGGLQEGYAVFRASIIHPSGAIVSQGIKTEVKADFPEFVEKAEMGSIGRALGAAGFGTIYAQEMDEGDKICDSPQGKGQPSRSDWGPPKPSGAMPTNPEVHDFPCSTCGADVDIELARKCQRTYGERVFCVKHKGEMDEGIEAQKSVAEAKPLYASKPAEGKPVTATKCSNCPRPLTQGVLTTSTRIYGKPLCFDCQKEESKARVAARPLS